MSDPRYTDPRLGEPLLRDPDRAQRLGELEASNAMWGWIAGGIVLALLMLFIFGRTPNTTDTASMQPPATTSTSMSTPRTPAAPTPAAPRPAPTTTGQGSSQQ